MTKTMGELLIFNEREVEAKGINKDNFIDKEKLKKYMFPEDYENLKILDSLNKFEMGEEVRLFYPGSGVDIFFPLIYLERLFSGVKKAKFIFVDIDSGLGIIKGMLDEVGVGFSEEENEIKFYWNNKLIELEFVEDNVSKVLEKLEEFDIYFERAFRIMKEQIINYEKNVFGKLKANGVVISDSGFKEVLLKRINVSQNLSAYKEMVIGVKE